MGSSSYIRNTEHCCVCFPKKTGTVFTGIISIGSNLCVILPCIYALIQPEFWQKQYKLVEEWVLGNHWDSEVTSLALKGLSIIYEYNNIFLMVQIGYCSLYISNAILLILGTMRERKFFILPWLIQDVLSIAVMSVLFVAWAFLSFFVDVLVAVLFPVIAGLILGFWIYLWRNVHDLYEDLNRRSHHLLVVSSSSVSSRSGGGGGTVGINSVHHPTVYKKLPVGGGSSSASSISSSNRRHRKSP